MDDDFYQEAIQIMTELMSHEVSKLFLNPIFGKPNSGKKSKKNCSYCFSEILNALLEKQYTSKEEWIHDVNHLFGKIRTNQKGTYFEDIIIYLSEVFEKLLNKSYTFSKPRKWIETVMNYKIKVTALIKHPPLIPSTIREVTRKINELNDSNTNQQIIDIINKHQPEVLSFKKTEIIQLNKLNQDTLNELNHFLDSVKAKQQ